MFLEGLPAKIAFFCIKCLIILHDIVSLPIYIFIDKPWEKWQQDKVIWARLEDENDLYSCYVRQDIDNNPNQNKIFTMDKLFEHAVESYGEKKCFGVRQIFAEEEETTNSGRIFKKLSLGEYKWMTYNEANQRVDKISKGLLSLGIQSKDRVVIFAETRVEWILATQALFRINAPLVTLYSTLGEDALVHCINETEIKYIITSTDQLPKLKSILKKTPNVTHVICMEGLIKATKDNISNEINFITFSELEERAEKNLETTFLPPSPEDLAILMYTSGSTGIPKGVMITHRNVITCVKGFDCILSRDKVKQNQSDTYIAYLPSAHVLELASECYLISSGVQVGFSSPQTLTDFSPAIKKGEKGDLTALQPTLMVSVPLILDRIRNSILLLAGKEGTFTRLLFDFAIKYKTFWFEKGFQTPWLNRYVFKTYREFMGGKLRAMMCGSAPLSADTQSFIRSCFNIQVLQGYGLTETAACATAMALQDNSVGRVGAPLATCSLRLVDWEEGKYFVTDKPYSRGEIVIGGKCLTLGYFKKEEETREAYRIENRQRWFYTGDIGEVYPNGTLKIIDRKKDLVKLQFGEYVALGKIEAEMKTNQLVENICVFGSILQNYLVALVIPNQHQLTFLAKEVGKGELSYAEMCSDEKVNDIVESKLITHAKKCKLFGSEIPRKIRLCSDEWNPESGLVTAALKLRRKYIENHYKDIVESMFNKINTINLGD